MILRPSESLTDRQVRSGLNYVIADGLATEAMVAFTGGAFLVAMAVHMGATNLQLGILAALPTFSSIFQLVSVWLVQRYHNRRAVTVLSNSIARFPLLLIGLLPFLFAAGTSVPVLIFLLFFHYYFGSVAGASWNSWMKDLVPGAQLGAYFSKRGRLTQTLNVILSLLIAMGLDYIRLHYPAMEMLAYSVMFLAGGVLGMLGIYALMRTPEPLASFTNDSMLSMLRRPLGDKNFRKLLVFNSLWAFALNLATPFFTVYMMKTLGMPLSWIVALGILAQVSGILSISMWGSYSDRYSNKTIIAICAPVYTVCIMAMAFTGMYPARMFSLGLLMLINVFSGITISGINLAITNIGIKLAPKDEAMIYLSARNIAVAFFSALAPLAGGLMADFFAGNQLVWNLEWNTGNDSHILHVLNLRGWNFFFIIGGLLAMFSLRFLKVVKEDGEVAKKRVVSRMHARVRIGLRDYLKPRTTSGPAFPYISTLLKKRVPGLKGLK